MKGRTGVRSRGPLLGEFRLASVDNKCRDAKSFLCDFSWREPGGQARKHRLKKEVKILENEALDVLHDENAAIMTISLLRSENLLSPKVPLGNGWTSPLLAPELVEEKRPQGLGIGLVDT